MGSPARGWVRCRATRNGSSNSSVISTSGPEFWSTVSTMSNRPCRSRTMPAAEVACSTRTSTCGCSALNASTARGHDGRARRGERREPQVSSAQGGQLGERRLRSLELGEHEFGMLHEDPPRLGEYDTSRPAFDEGHAGLALQRGDLLGDGRRRIGQRLGRAGQRTATGDLTEHLQAAHVQHEARVSAGARALSPVWGEISGEPRVHGLPGGCRYCLQLCEVDAIQESHRLAQREVLCDRVYGGTDRHPPLEDLESIRATYSRGTSACASPGIYAYE